MNARVDAAQREVQAGLERDGGVRPVLHGQASADNALDHYQRAVSRVQYSDPNLLPFDELRALLKKSMEQAPLPTRMREATEDELTEHRNFASEFAPVLDELRRGAQSGHCNFTINWEAQGLSWEGGIRSESLA